MALWTPAEITTLMWFDAADSGTITESSGSVSQWDDKSGNGHHLVQATGSDQPTTNSDTQNGLNVITIPGSGEFMSVSGVSKPSEYAVYVVAKCGALSGTQTVVGSVDSAGTSSRVWGEVSQVSSGLQRWWFGDDSLYRYGTSTNVVFSASGYTINGCTKPASGDCTIYADGTAETNTGLTGTATACSGATYDFSVGRFGAYNGLYFGGYVAEVVVCDSELSTSDREKLEGYLAWRWGIEGNLPAGHTYENAAPTTGGGGTPGVVPRAIQSLENQYAAIAASGLNGVVQ